MGIFKKIAELLEGKPSVKDTERFFEYACKLQHEGKITEAIACFEEMHQNNSLYYDAYSHLFELYPKVKEWDKLEALGKKFDDGMMQLTYKTDIGKHAMSEARRGREKDSSSYKSLHSKINIWM